MRFMTDNGPALLATQSLTASPLPHWSPDLGRGHQQNPTLEKSCGNVVGCCLHNLIQLAEKCSKYAVLKVKLQRANAVVIVCLRTHCSLNQDVYVEKTVHLNGRLIHQENGMEIQGSLEQQAESAKFACLQGAQLRDRGGKRQQGALRKNIPDFSRKTKTRGKKKIGSET